MVQAQSEGPTSGARDTSCSAVSGPRFTGIPPHNLRYRSVFAGTVSTELLVLGDNGLSSLVVNSLSASIQSVHCPPILAFGEQNHTNGRMTPAG